MAETELTEFLRSKARGTDGIDGEALRREWLAAVEDLYSLIRDRYLASAIAAGFVKVRRQPKTITEQFLGTYDVDELVLEVGSEVVTFSPVGRTVLGAAGRVDLEGDAGRLPVVLADTGWSLILQRRPPEVVPLEEGSLLRALKIVMRP